MILNKLYVISGDETLAAVHFSRPPVTALTDDVQNVSRLKRQLFLGLALEWVQTSGSGLIGTRRARCNRGGRRSEGNAGPLV